jgi:hypothetical protein
MSYDNPSKNLREESASVRLEERDEERRRREAPPELAEVPGRLQRHCSSTIRRPTSAASR